MFSQLGLGNTMGIPSSSGQGLANAYSPYQQQAGWNQASGATAYNQLTSIHARQPEPPARWRVDGKDVSFEEFVQLVFPEDTPERTFFLLKFSK
jgi:hypothetical protein